MSREYVSSARFHDVQFEPRSKQFEVSYVRGYDDRAITASRERNKRVVLELTPVDRFPPVCS